MFSAHGMIQLCDHVTVLAASNVQFVALALICAVQYVLYSHRTRVLRRKLEDDTRNLLRLQKEVSALQKDHAQIRFENQIFEEFIAQSNYDAAMAHLLKRFVPNTNNGFGAWLEKRGNAFVWCHTRGFSTDEMRSLSFNGEWLGEFEHQDFQIYDDSSFRHSFIYSYLPAAERRRVNRLFVFAIRHNSQITGLLVSTSLYPAGMAIERRISLALRLLNGLEAHFHHSEVIRTQKTQLKTTQEMLELHAVCDQHRGSVKTLVEVFLECLLRQLGADRGLLAFAKTHRQSEIRSIQRVGLRPADGVAAGWEDDERRLIKIGQHRRAAVILDAEELDLHGFQGPIQFAILLPIIPREETLGTLCVMKHTAEPLDEDELRHVRWAAEFLSETLRRTLDQATIEMQATSDPLTGLVNRRTFDDRLGREVGRAVQRERDCSLLMLDLDHFKSINDTFGHLAGDLVLRRVAETVKTTLASTGALRPTAARYGGEELAIILPGTGMQAAQVIAEQVRTAIERLDLEFKGLECPLTASLGVAAVTETIRDANALIASADEALYRAKDAGRNRVVCVAGGPDAIVG